VGADHARDFDVVEAALQCAVQWVVDAPLACRALGAHGCAQLLKDGGNLRRTIRLM
jgi:hypothetical protein